MSTIDRQRKAATLLLVLACLLPACVHRTEPRTVSRLEISVTGPHLADGNDRLAVQVKAFDSEGRPLSDARIRTNLIFGIDEIEAADAIGHGNGTYVAQFTSMVAGPMVVQAHGVDGDVSANAFAFFTAGEPVDLNLSLEDAKVLDQRLAVRVVTNVTDRFGNPTVPVTAKRTDDLLFPESPPGFDDPRARIVFATDFGLLDDVRVNPDGTASVRVSSDIPGVATVTATDLGSGLSRTREVTFPAVALKSPAACLITDQPGEDRTFPVSVQVFTGREDLLSYDLLIDFNELTAFSGLKEPETEDQLPLPHLEIVDRNRLRISLELPAGSPLPAPRGFYRVATLSFECLGEGDSVVTVVEAALAGSARASSRTARPKVALLDEPRETAICTNKRAKHVCVNPIVVEGAGKASDITDQLRAGLEHIQENLDEACCAILLSQKETQELTPTETYQEEVRRNTDRNRDNDVVQTEWDARSVGSSMLNEINLSEGMTDLLCDSRVRNEKCINVYVVEDQSLWGRFPPIGEAGEQGAQAVEFLETQLGHFAGDIKRQRLKPDGTSCEDLKIFRGTGPDRTEIPKDECRVDAVVITPNSFRSLKHEVGHMLGLRHPWEYTDAKLQEIKDAEVADPQGRRSIMWYYGQKEIFTMEECEMIMEHNCNGFQLDFSDC